MYCKNRNYSTTLTQWTTLQNLFVPFYGKTSYTVSSQMLTCNTPAVEGWHKQPCLDPVPASPSHLRWITGRQHHLRRAPSHGVLHRALALRLLCLGDTVSAWGKKMSCLPTQIYLEACHIGVWGVNSQEDGRLQTSCACTMGPRTLCPSEGSKHISGWSGKWHLDSSHCSLPCTRSYRQHCHTSRKVWRAENPRKCCREKEWAAQHPSMWAAD